MSKSLKMVRQVYMACAMKPMDWIMHLIPNMTTITLAQHVSAMASTNMPDEMQFLRTALFSPVTINLIQSNQQ
jgi:hypothetical protein